MCCEESARGGCCGKPDRLKERPEECTPEQIRECHGEVREHPCAPEGGKRSGSA
jgi:hypothetical protein